MSEKELRKQKLKEQRRETSIMTMRRDGGAASQKKKKNDDSNFEYICRVHTFFKLMVILSRTVGWCF